MPARTFFAASVIFCLALFYAQWGWARGHAPITSLPQGVSVSHSWSPQEVRAYGHRQFIELAQLMVERHQNSLLAQVSRQELDLRGCLAIHRGVGDLRDLVTCMRFTSREHELGLTSAGTALVVKDLVFLCQKLIKKEGDVRFLARAGILKIRPNTWQSCIDKAWRQVYLTVAARFDAEPVSVLSYVRTAEAGLPRNSQWAERAVKLIHETTLARHLK